jgi:hypothetical protein
VDVLQSKPQTSSVHFPPSTSVVGEGTRMCISKESLGDAGAANTGTTPCKPGTEVISDLLCLKTPWQLLERTAKEV